MEDSSGLMDAHTPKLSPHVEASEAPREPVGDCRRCKCLFSAVGQLVCQRKTAPLFRAWAVRGHLDIGLYIRQPGKGGIRYN